MKSSLFPVAVMVAVLAASLPCAAQNDSNAGGQKQNWMISFLPQADQDRVVSAHSKAVADNPDLQAQGQELAEEGPGMKAASPQDRQAFMAKVEAYRQKMRQAMLKEDPSLGPVLDQIDKHIAAIRAQHEQQAAGGGGATQ